MIRQISIQNIAIAERLVVDFGPRLNIVTGETGAGKSLLVDALSLLRGMRADMGLIRTGSDFAQVCGVFSLPSRSPARAMMVDLGIEPDGDELILRRVVQRNGKHRAFVNDVPVSLRAFQGLAEELIDISSQFENQRLLNADTHTLFLDAFAGCDGDSESLRKGFEESQQLRRELDAARKERDLRRRQKDLCEFELAEIGEAALSREEFERIEEILLLARKASSAQALCSEALGVLAESEQSCLSQLRLVKKNLEKLQRMSQGTRCDASPSLADAASAAIEDLVTSLSRIQETYALDSQAVSEAEERIEVYNRLLRKFGPTLDDVFRHAEECRVFLQSSDSLDARMEELSATLKAQACQLVSAGKTLSQRRAASTADLCRAVERELADLGMAQARFVCELAAESPTPHALPSEVASHLEPEVADLFGQLGRCGFERARFLLSANPGMAPQAIEKVASGGELSRVMLAIKTVLFSGDSVNLFVFDEIDTGISGNVASKVGRKLADFCKRRQAVCVTHLPQVACHAEAHFVARKHVRANQTTAEIVRVAKNDRVTELARLLAGEKIVPESLAQARALLAEANGLKP